MRRPIAALLAALLTTTGCTIPMSKRSTDIDTAWRRHAERLERISGFTLAARVASGGLFGMKGSVNWRQHGEQFDIRISGPFGIGAITLSGRVDDVTLTTREGSWHTDDPDGWLRQHLGWSFPVEGLRYWIVGLPSPYSDARISLDREGRLALLEQDGWEVAFEEYQRADGLDLPRRIRAEHPEVRLKIVIDAWRISRD